MPLYQMRVRELLLPVILFIKNMIDKDYLEYLRGTGKWTEEQKLMWDFLTEMMDILVEIRACLPEIKKDEMMAQFRIQPQQSSSGVQPVKKDYTSR